MPLLWRASPNQAPCQVLCEHNLVCVSQILLRHILSLILSTNEETISSMVQRLIKKPPTKGRAGRRSYVPLTVLVPLIRKSASICCFLYIFIFLKVSTQLLRSLQIFFANDFTRSLAVNCLRSQACPGQALSFLGL